MLRMKQNKNKVQEVYATNKLKKWQKRGWDINKLKANE